MEPIVKICNDIYKQLGPAHNECVYQKALMIELYNNGAESVEFEKHVPVFFKDTKGTIHTIGTERVDLLATFADQQILIELKAVARNRLQSHVEQVHKYKRALAHLGVYPTLFLLINFPQQPIMTEDSVVESMVIA